MAPGIDAQLNTENLTAKKCCDPQSANQYRIKIGMPSAIILQQSFLCILPQHAKRNQAQIFPYRCIALMLDAYVVDDIVKGQSPKKQMLKSTTIAKGKLHASQKNVATAKIKIKETWCCRN